ncbi:MAG: hypothetical protein QXR19_16515 [Candidatus Jordarchaeaceae archaeon]
MSGSSSSSRRSIPLQLPRRAPQGVSLDVTLSEAMASVGRETYTAVLREREARRAGDRFRRRVNRNPKEALEKIIEENRKLYGSFG